MVFHTQDIRQSDGRTDRWKRLTSEYVDSRIGKLSRGARWEGVTTCFSRYNYSTTSTQTQTTTNTMSEKSLLKAYFSLLDGTKTWEEVHPAAENLVAPEYILETEHHAIDRQEWLGSIENFVKGGGTVDVISLEEVSNGVQWEVFVHNPCGSVIRMASVGRFKNGKLFRVEPVPVDLSAYNKDSTSPDEKYKEKVIHLASSFSQRERFKIADKKHMPLYW